MGSPAFHAILKELGETHEQKDAEYSGNDPLSNYKVVEEWGDEPWKSALYRAEEKRKRHQNRWKSGQELRRDDWIDWISHLINSFTLYEETHK